MKKKDMKRERYVKRNMKIERFKREGKRVIKRYEKWGTWKEREMKWNKDVKS